MTAGPRSLPGRVAFRLAHLVANAAVAARWQVRRSSLVARLRLSAWWNRASLDLDVARDVRLGRGLRFAITQRSTNTLCIGERCKIGDDVRVELRGGALRLGPDVDIRMRCMFGVGGDVSISGRNILQPGASLHCDLSIAVGYGSSLGEYCTVIDSSHRFDGPNDWWVQNIAVAPVAIGGDSWIGAKATICKGVVIGEGAVVSGNSLVVRDVPARHVASGVPATTVRPLTGDAGHRAKQTALQ
ncbi:MAG TPA: acyltransferase [Mycobacterium sp.]|nr:acyltransferase [Mycobacterium sp.]